VQGIQFLPVAAFLLAVSFRILGPGWRLTKTYAVLAVLSPLTLYFTGLDWYRWMTLCTLRAWRTHRHPWRARIRSRYS
jgi:hypothetical protein